MKRFIRWMKIALSQVSITGKIIGISIGAVILLGVFTMLEVRTTLTETLTKQLEEKGISMGRDLAARSTDFMLTNNVYFLQELVNQTVKNHQDIRYVFILDDRGNVVVHSFGEKGMNPKLVSVNSVKPSEEYRLQLIETTEGFVRDIAVPVLDGKGGMIRLGLTEKTLNESMGKVTNHLLLTIFAIVMIWTGVALFLTKVVTDPLYQLVAITKKVARGDLSARIHHHPGDEIGILTKAFNQMLIDLQELEKERTLYNNKLLLRNRELSLLHELSGTYTTISEFREILENFLAKLVDELDFSNADVHLNMGGEAIVCHSGNQKSPLCLTSLHEEEYNCDKCWKEGRKISTFRFPILLNQTGIGELKLCGSQTLDPQSSQILQSVTNQIAITVENMRLWDELQQKEKVRRKLLEKVIKVQEEERKRIARELHDETSQSLTSLLIGLGQIQDMTHEASLIREMERLKELTHLTLQEVHELSWNLRPSVLDKFGLVVALERYVQDYQEKYKLEVDLLVTGIHNYRFSSEIETSLYRIVQESLTNIARYAQAQTVSIIIEKRDQQLSVIVEDDGVGFNVEEVLRRDPTKHNLGLHGMRERVLLLGGNLTIESNPGTGTTIYVKVPILEEGGEIIEQDQDLVG